MAWRERDHPRDGEGRFRDKGSWARRISDQLGLPSAKDLLQRDQDQDSVDFTPQLAGEFEGSYGREGRMQVSQVSVARYGGGSSHHSPFSPLGHLNIAGQISTGPDDLDPGYFRVTASQIRKEKETDPLTWSAHIDRMHAHSAGGSGGGRELTDRFVDWFRHSGFDEVTVGPSQMGSYSWGAMGFDFEDHESRRIAWSGAMEMSVQRVRDWYRHEGHYYGLSDEHLSDAQIKKMIGQYRRATSVALAGGMSYQRLSQYGRRGQDASGMWAGKLGLLIGGVGSGRIKL
jgi:hypothetical protein